MKYKAVLFDFDGTLADTLPVCFYSFQTIFKKYDGRTLSKKEMIEMFGPSETGIIEHNLQNKEKMTEAIEDYYSCYEREHCNLVRMNEEIIYMIEHLRKRKISIGIVTGKARKSLEISLKHLFLSEFYKVAISGDDVVNPKPHPEGINKALKVLGISPQNTLYVGDSNADIEAGKRADVETAGVNWLINSHGSAFTIKPDYEFSSITDFMKIF